MSRSAEQLWAAVKPRLRENVWYIDPQAETALLVTGQGRFEVPVPDALRFLQLRSHCTGHVALPEIVKRSGLSPEEIGSIIEALHEVGAVYPLDAAAQPAPSRPDLAEVKRRLTQATRIWREEYRVTNLNHELVAGLHSGSVLVGWLLEQYHIMLYIAQAFAAAAARCCDRAGASLRALCEARRPYAELVARTLIGLGLSRTEVERSIPLLSTRLLCFQLRELLEGAPWSAFIVETIRGAQALDDAQIAELRVHATARYHIDPAALEPWFELQRFEARHAGPELAAEHADLIDVDDVPALDAICNQVHDIRHAFDLLALEVKDYHQSLQGKYVPRQAVSYSDL